ncbi:hypothetical protein DSM110277_03753 (plasmid) [Sulfitobacter pontiacus]|uniref:Uncharacterized protein n=1 Tax=Sulfitobacter pontiacus TaxID=60137 RepID=A0AAX3AHK3_9RHOB|nr:hypothetical protein [Sulfitobacter pontiacus]UOA25299.1 hypothetical protein DSM110277_03753 [Sulfitobacter pontiacus]
MTNSTSHAISTLTASYYPEHFSDLERIINLIEALIASGNRFAAECGANPSAEFENIALSYRTFRVRPDYATLQKAVEHRHCIQHSSLPRTTRFEMINICHTEMLQIAHFEGFSEEKMMRFAYLRASLIMCATISFGHEAKYIDDALEGLKMKSDMLEGNRSVSFAELDGRAEEAPVDMLETCSVFGETFEQGAHTNLTELASARDGDLTGVLIRHCIVDDGPNPESRLVAAITSEAGTHRLELNFSKKDIKLQAMAGILAFRTPAVDVIQLFDLSAIYASAFSLHFKDFAIAFAGQDEWNDTVEEMEHEVSPFILLGSGEASMTTDKIRAIQAGIATLQQHSDFSWLPDFEYKPFGPD